MEYYATHAAMSIVVDSSGAHAPVHPINIILRLNPPNNLAKVMSETSVMQKLLSKRGLALKRLGIPLLLFMCRMT